MRNTADGRFFLEVSIAPELLQLARQSMVFAGVATAGYFLASPQFRDVATEEQEYTACVSQLAAAFNLSLPAARDRFRAYHTRQAHSWRHCYHEVLSGRADW